MIIACTGHTEEMYINKAWQSQMDEVLAKPARQETIISLLKEILVVE